MTALSMQGSVRGAGHQLVPGNPLSALRDRVTSSARTRLNSEGAQHEPARGSAVRLTRRGRLLLIGLPVVTGVAALLVVAAVFLLPRTVNASTVPVGQPVTHAVTVQAHQSLWELAVEADPDRDPREVMSDIAQLNDLTSPELSAGQVLEVPSR